VGIAAMLMTFVVAILDILGFTIRNVSELESDSVAVERIR
jgi:Na+-transporting methylmalonyl-CoA/oxaloacetate decarboxylase gamma subunit